MVAFDHVAYSDRMPFAESWIPLVVATIAALASILAAVVAGLFARTTRRAELGAQRDREQEARLAERKYAMYRPMIEMLREMFTTDKLPTPEQQAQKEEFATWIGVFGSDEAVLAFDRFMQMFQDQLYPPVEVQHWLYANFLLAARRDIGYPNTALERRHMLGLRLSDVYQRPNLFAESFDDLCRRVGWWPGQPDARPAPAAIAGDLSEDVTGHERPPRRGENDLSWGWNGLAWGSTAQEFLQRFPDGGRKDGFEGQRENGSDGGWWITGEDPEDFCGIRMPAQYAFNDHGRFYMVVFYPEIADRERVAPKVLIQLGAPEENDKAWWRVGPVNVEVKVAGSVVSVTNRELDRASST